MSGCSYLTFSLPRCVRRTELCRTLWSKRPSLLQFVNEKQRTSFTKAIVRNRDRAQKYIKRWKQGEPIEHRASEEREQVRSARNIGVLSLSGRWYAE
eukprot:1185418-Prorocentrum_minimum.AAC.3